MASRNVSLAAVLATVAVAMGTATACSDDGDSVQGSGTIVTETRDVSGFDEIQLLGSGDVTVEMGDSESLTVETDDNLVDLITTEVRGSRLVIENDEPLSPTDEIVFRIGAIRFEGISIIGSGDVTAEDVDCDTFSISAAGAGSFEIAGTCDALEVDIAGSGNVDVEGLTVARAEVSIAGSGDVIVNASEELEVSIAGSGDVVYLGDPSTSIDISGSGNVSRVP